MKFFAFVLCCFLVEFLQGQNVLAASEFVINSTLKIETIDKKIDSGKVSYYQSSGTGFFFSFKFPEGEIPVIVTNKHVIIDALRGTLNLKTLDSSDNFNYGNFEKVEIDFFKKYWIFHPDSNVDLAIMPIMPLIKNFEARKKKIAYAAYDEYQIPNDSISRSLSAIEEILMIGYPFGLRDIVNDVPIVRKGITATPHFLNYNSTKEFLCDLPVYPGSSGSPIIILNSGNYSNRKGGTIIGTRLLLLGINYATYTKDFSGKIIPKASYNISDSLITNTSIPYNIGIAIKSDKILDFKPILRRIIFEGKK